MATVIDGMFGKIGDKVQSSSLNCIGFIVDNKVRLNSIQVKSDHPYCTDWSIYNLTILTTEDKNMTKNNTNWEFKTASVVAIDWDLIISELSHDNLLFTINVKRSDNEQDQFVAIHSHLLKKALSLDIKLPGKHVSHYPNIFICKKHFGEWVAWAKAVKSAPWHKQLNDCKITVKPIKL